MEIKISLVLRIYSWFILLPKTPGIKSPLELSWMLSSFSNMFQSMIKLKMHNKNLMKKKEIILQLYKKHKIIKIWKELLK